MRSAISLSDDLMQKVDIAAKINMRSKNKQVEYWANLGMLAEENKDLPLEVILGTLRGLEEMDRGLDQAFELDQS